MFWTEAQRLMEGLTYSSTVSKFYNGLGQLVQVQTEDAVLHDGTKDIIVDTFYRCNGKSSI